jgi:hypothetical protein
MADQPEDKAEYFRQRAAEARAIADSMSNGPARTTMISAAELWDRMALREDKKIPRPSS